MAGGTNQPTALGIARARFVEGLARRAGELTKAIDQLRASPDDDRGREEMRRRLHALFASAQVFRIEALAAALQAAIARLDAARDESRALSAEDLDALAHLSSTLVDLGGDQAPDAAEAPGPAPTPPPAAEPPSPPAPDPSPETQRATSLPVPVGPPAAPAGGGASGPSKPSPPKPAAAEPGSAKAPPVPAKAAVVHPAPPKPAVPKPPSAPSPATPPSSKAIPKPAAPSRSAPSGARPGAETQRRPGGGKGDTSPAGGAMGTGGRDPLRTPATAKGTPPVPARAVPTKPPPAAPGPVVPSPAGESADATPASEEAHAPGVISVLLVAPAEAQEKLVNALPAERFEVLRTSDPEEALQRVRMASPDVLVASHLALPEDGKSWVERLRGDRTMGPVSVVLVASADEGLDADDARALGVDHVLREPVENAVLVQTLEQLARLPGEGGGPLTPMGEATLAQVADRVAEEVRRGLLETAEGDRDVPIPLGEGAPVLAAAWSAVGRVRAEVAQRSGGRLRFRDGPRRGASLMTLGTEAEPDLDGPGSEVDLSGRRLLVVDDDPAVVWFFAGLLREEGATVAEAHDGREALDVARRFHPEVILSDILMPEMDGLTLCRELARDPGLHEVPVVLLSWKEDYLQRMRELSSGARGYLRKEAGAGQILAQVREVLLPRARVEAQLAEADEVRGRIEGIGVVPLLRLVASRRPDARLTVRDAWNLFEVDLRGGELRNLTRTATDGSFQRGPAALPRLVGVTGGRFTVVREDGPVRAAFEGPMGRLLDDTTRRLGAVLDAVSGAHLARAAKVSFDEDALEAIQDTLSPAERGILERLHQGERPRDLLADDHVELPALERLLADLARRGAIGGVRGIAGEDRVQEMWDAREPQDGTVEPGVGVEETPAVDGGAPPVQPDEGAWAPVPPLPASPPEAREPADAPAPAVPEPPMDPLHAPVPAMDPSPPPAVEPEEAIPAPDARPAAWKWVALALVAAAVAVGGYHVWDGTRAERMEGAQAAASAPPSQDTDAPADRGGEPPPAEAGPPPLEQELAYGEDVPGVDDSAGVEVGPGQALLIVRGGPEGAQAELRVDGEPVGSIPAAVALAAGRHELELRRGGEVSFRYVYLREGHTRVVTRPLEP